MGFQAQAGNFAAERVMVVNRQFAVGFGMNESFQGPDRVDPFRHELRKFVEKLQEQPFNGESTPRIVLVSPFAHEKLNNDLPDGIEHNQNLRLYSEALAQVAEQHTVFLDKLDLLHGFAVAGNHVFARSVEPLRKRVREVGPRDRVGCVGRSVLSHGRPVGQFCLPEES